jgi:predicted transcriptional regulator
MIKKLKEVLERAQSWPMDAQEELARMAYEIEEELKGEYHATPEELRAIDEGLRASAEGRIASEEEVEAAFRKFRQA